MSSVAFFFFKLVMITVFSILIMAVSGSLTLGSPDSNELIHTAISFFVGGVFGIVVWTSLEQY